jgi:hypothetical protein
MEASDFYHEETSNVSIQTKYMANDFYRSLTNAMRQYVVESSKETITPLSEEMSRNVWTMMTCFWYSFKYSSRIFSGDREEMDGLYIEDTINRVRIYTGQVKKKDCHKGILTAPFDNADQAMFAMDKLFEKAGKAGIFIDFSLQLGDYDPEKIEREVTPA